MTFLLLPLLIGGYLAAVLVFKATATAAAPWRAAILTGYAIVGAVLTDLIAGPLIGAYSGSHFWPLLPCFALITTAVVLAAAAIQGLAGRLGTFLVLALFLAVGGSAAGGIGVSLLPAYWQVIGVVFPPRSAGNLIRNVLYFGGSNITAPLIVLFAYALFGVVVIAFLGRIRPARQAAAAKPPASLSGRSELDDAVDVVALQEELGLPRVPREPVDDEAEVPVVPGEPVPDHRVHQVVPDQFPGRHDPAHLRAHLGVVLHVPPEDVTHADVHQVQVRRQHLGLRALAAAARWSAS